MTPLSNDPVAMTVRFPKRLHWTLKRAAFDRGTHISTLVNEGAVLRVASLDDTLAKALADADPGNDYTWEGLGTDQAHYRLMAGRVMDLLLGVSR
jgi:hypothetical protein